MNYLTIFIYFPDSSRQHVISTGLEDPLIYQKIEIDEPNAYTDVLSSESIVEKCTNSDDDSDDEDDDKLYGFENNDSKIMRSLNRHMDLKNFYRHGLVAEIHWNPTRSITPYRKRNYPDVVKSVYNTFAGDKSVNATPHGVPKRRRCQKLNQ